jgi:ABC-type sugar transport system ATPase subunit
MNFLPSHRSASTGDQPPCLADGGPIAVDTAEFASPALTPGQKVDVGIRPHDLALARPERRRPRSHAGYVELLGPEIQAHGALAGAPIVAALETQSGARKGDRIPLSVKRLQLFDAESGRSLR